VGGVTLDPTILDPAKTLGIRAKTTINFNDHPFSDNGVDPYVIAREYDPLETGTFWGKFLSRNPNYEGKPLRLTVGYIDDDGQFLAGPERLFIIDKIMGPDSGGNVKLIAKDILASAENDKQKLPKVTQGKLFEDINETQTSLIIQEFFTQYPEPGVIRIGSELMTFTKNQANFTIQRGQYGTQAAAHSAGASVQNCIRYENRNVINIVRDLLVTAGFSTSFIPFADWEAERDIWLELNNYSRIISKPTGVSKLLSELCEQSLISIWWDERQKEIKLKSASPPVDFSTIPVINDSVNFIKGSLKVDRLTDQRITQLWLYSQLENQIDDNKKQESYDNVNVVIDAQSEELFGNPREKIILGTWLTDVSEAVKIDITSKTINKFKVSPIKATFAMDAKDSDIWTGDIIFVETDRIQTTTGAPSRLVMVVTKARESILGTTVNYEATTAFDYVARVGQWTDDAANSYNDASGPERAVNGYWTDDEGRNPDGSEGTTYF
jgi:hypothetical protein